MHTSLPRPMLRGPVSVLSASLLLAACGGGGGASPEAASVVDAALAAAAPDAAQPSASTKPAPLAHQLAPYSYRMKIVRASMDRQVQIAQPRQPGPAPQVWQAVVAADGRFVATALGPEPSGFHDLAPHAIEAGPTGPVQEIGLPYKELQSFPTAINNSGLVSLTVEALDGPEAAYAWTASGGLQPLPPINDVFESEARFVTDSGWVAGIYCVRTNFRCDTFRWRPDDGSLTTATLFDPMAINQSGTIVGFQGSADGSNSGSRLATLSAAGTVTPVEPNPPRGEPSRPRIADDGQITFSLFSTLGDLRPGMVVIRDGKAFNVGYGIAPDADPSKEKVGDATSDDRSGNVIGVDYPLGPESSAAPTGFFWSAASGTLKVSVDEEKAWPLRVNKQGVVVGTTSEGAFVWHKDTGGFLLDPLVINLRPGSHLGAPQAIGDGGHIVVGLDTGELVLLIPNPGCFGGS